MLPGMQKIACLLILFLVLVLAGCSGCGESTSVAPATITKEKAPVALHDASPPDTTVDAEQTASPPQPPELTLTASVEVKEHTLTYRSAENGSVEGASPQTVQRGESGSAVTAIPAAGYHFTGWSDGSTANPRTDSKVTTSLTVTARFAINQYTLTYAAQSNGSIRGASAQKVSHGGSGSAVTAVPAAGYHFLDWSDGSTANPRTESNLVADREVTARFAINQYTLTYTAESNGSIAGASVQSVNHGDSGSVITAVADHGYHFESWSDGLTTASRTDSGITGDLKVSAVFAVNTYNIGGKVSGLVKGTEVVLQNSGGDNLTISRNGDFTFATALLGGSSYATTVLAQPTGPNQTCTVTRGSGTVADADVSNVEVNCILNTYTIGGTLSGLPDGNQVVLRNNKGDDLALGANGEFTFAKGLGDGSPYEVTIHKASLRPNWVCKLENATGKLAGSNVTQVGAVCFPEAIVQPLVGHSKIELSWNSDDFNGAVFNLCRAEEDIPEGGFDRCVRLQGGTAGSRVSKPLTLTKLVNDTPYWFQLEVRHADGRRTYSKTIKATPIGGLNDTGIDWCATANTVLTGAMRAEKIASCNNAATHPGQDAHFGRDAEARARSLVKIGGGVAGFDFTKVCMSGQGAGEGSCPPNPGLGNGPNNWACTRDNITGLLWEVKTADGLRGKNNTYSWYYPAGSKNGGEPGLQNGGNCKGGSCDTHAYVRAVNTLGLCGVSDWRVPTRKELLSIVDSGRIEPAIDTDYFPHAVSAPFWTSTPYADNEKSAWHVFFRYGESYSRNKSESSHVRLVRGRTGTYGHDNP
jgi:hypothetical protein